MKVSAACVLLLFSSVAVTDAKSVEAADKIAQLKQKIMKKELKQDQDSQNGEGMATQLFSYDPAVNEICFKVKKTPVRMAIPAFLQTDAWNPIPDKAFDMKGYDMFRTDKQGLSLKSSKGDKAEMACNAARVTEEGKDALNFYFKCGAPEAKVDPARFSQIKKADASCAGITSSFWNPVYGGCPYGFENYSWNGWSEPYFSVGAMGVYGCGGINTCGFCDAAPYVYSFSP